MTDIQILGRMTGETDMALLEALLQESEERLLALTGRTTLPAVMGPAKRSWAVVAYNRMGMEGETSRTEAGISSAFAEIPADISQTVQRYRLARVGGKYHESTED